MISAILLALQQPRIDVREPAAVGSVMLQRIGKAFGAKLYAGPGIADVPLIFDVKGVTFEEFRAVSAKGLDATWRQTREGWELYRTPEQTKAEEDAFLAKRAALIKREIALRTKEPSMAQVDLDEMAIKVKLASNDDLFEIAYQYDVVSNESLLFDVWNDLGATHFASLPIDRRWVYTSDGRSGTKKLPVLDDVMRRLRLERERVVAALKKHGAWERLASSVGAFDPDSMLRYLGFGDVQTLLLEVVSTQSTVGLNLTGFDKSGNTCLNYFDSVASEEPARSKLTDIVTDADVVLGPESVELHAAYQRLFEGGDEAEFDLNDALEPYVKVLARLEERDVLGYDVSDVLFTAAAQSGKPLVGRLSDDMVYDSPFFQLGGDRPVTNGKFKLRAGLAWVDDFLQLDAGDTLRVTPELPSKYQAYFPRKAMMDYVKVNRGRRLVDLERISAVMAPPTSLDADELGDMALIVHPQYQSLHETDFAVLSAWADLSQQQKAQAASRGGVTVPLSRSGKKLQYNMRYNAVNYGQWSMLHGSLEGAEYDEESDTEAITDWMLFDVDASSLKDLELNFRTRRAPAVQIHREEYGDQPVTVTATELAAWVFELESDPEYKDEVQNLINAKFGIVEQMTIEMRYSTPVGVMFVETSVQTTEGGRTDYAFAQLPASFLNEYSRELAALRRGN